MAASVSSKSDVIHNSVLEILKQECYNEKEKDQTQLNSHFIMNFRT